MRKLYNEFFYIPKHGKVREKVMLTRLVSTIIIVIVCLAAMSITAYAYFSANITSGSNIIKSANFKTEVQVMIFDSDENLVETDDIKIITSDRKSFLIEGLTVGETYTFVIKPIEDETSAKTGFVILTADNCPDIYHTQQLGIDEKASNEYTESLTFKLMITDTSKIILQAHWGTSSQYPKYQNVNDNLYITNGETVEIIVGGHEEPNIPKTTSNSTTSNSTTSNSDNTEESSNVSTEEEILLSESETATEETESKLTSTESQEITSDDTKE